MNPCPANHATIMNQVALSQALSLHQVQAVPAGAESVADVEESVIRNQP